MCLLTERLNWRTINKGLYSTKTRENFWITQKDTEFYELIELSSQNSIIKDHQRLYLPTNLKKVLGLVLQIFFF